AADDRPRDLARRRRPADAPSRRHLRRGAATAGGRSRIRRPPLLPPSRLAGDLACVDRNFSGGPGWQEVVAAPSDGVKLTGSSVPDRDVSGALRAYPEDMLQAPLRVSEARMRLSAGGPVASTTPLPVGSRSGAERFG